MVEGCYLQVAFVEQPSFTPGETSESMLSIPCFKSDFAAIEPPIIAQLRTYCTSFELWQGFLP